MDLCDRVSLGFLGAMWDDLAPSELCVKRTRVTLNTTQRGSNNVATPYEDAKEKPFIGARQQDRNSIHCAVHLSPEEAELVTRIAKALKCSMAEFMRLALHEVAQQIVQFERESSEAPLPEQDAR